MAGLTPQGRKYDDLVTKMDAAFEPVVQQMANDQAVGDADERAALVTKVVSVFTNKFYWDSPALPTKIQCQNKMGKEDLVKQVSEGDADVERPDVKATALMEQVLEM